MFEKEAEEYAEGTKTEKELEVLNTVHYWGQESLDPNERRLFEGIQDRKRAREQGFKDGAEFGYNKANEWHYVNWKYFADKDYPESETASYLVRLRNKDTLICEWETEEGFGNFWDSNFEPIDNDDVYSWKEIIPPKENLY